MRLSRRELQNEDEAYADRFLQYAVSDMACQINAATGSTMTIRVLGNRQAYDVMQREQNARPERASAE